jgi:hypothetical protein
MKWILVAVMALILQLFLPWWSIVLAGLTYGFLFIQKPGKAFLGGFLGIFLLWGIMASYITYVNDGILAARLASLFSLPHGLFAVLATALTGGLAGGVSALTGNLFRSLPVVNKWRKILPDHWG